MTTLLARLSDLEAVAIPIVADAAERDTHFGVAPLNQRVHDLSRDVFQIYSGGVWRDLPRSLSLTPAVGVVPIVVNADAGSSAHLVDLKIGGVSKLVVASSGTLAMGEGAAPAFYNADTFAKGISWVAGNIFAGGASKAQVRYIGNTLELGTQTAGEKVVIKGGNGANAIEADDSAVADDTRLLVHDVTANVRKRVSRGAIDSGGAGFRVLRVPN